MSIALSQSCIGASTYPPSSAGGSGGTAGTYWVANVTAGDVVVCAVIIPGTGNPGTITVADDLSNSYTALNHYYDSTNTAWVGLFYIVQPSTRSPTVTATLGTTQYGNIVLAEFSGFVGTVIEDSTAKNTAGGNSSSFSLTPVDNAQSEELILCAAFLNYGWYVVPSGWTAIPSVFQNGLYYAVVPSASTNTPFTGTLGNSAAWDGATDGLYGIASSYSLSLASATYTLSGMTATLNETGGINPYILCFPGVYNLLGAPSSSDFVFQSPAAGRYAYTGFPTGTVSYSLALAAASYALTGQTVTFPPTGVTFPLGAGSYSITGFTATLTEAAQPSGLMMPYLVGLLYEEAQYVLAHSEILTITPPYQNYFTTPFPITLVWVKSSKPPSTVLAQSIPAGITVAINAPMTLTLSQYPIAISITDP